MAHEIVSAAVFPAGARLLVAVGVFLVWVAMVPRPAPRPLAVAACCVVVVVWDFGATLIWGTAGLSKVRFGFVLSTVGRLSLLAVAIVGIVAVAGALRQFAHGQQRLGTLLGGLFVVGFAGWSSAVRYSPILALAGLLTGSVALWWAARMPAGKASASIEQPSARPSTVEAALRVVPTVVVPCLAGALFYAYLTVGPKSWADPRCGASFLVPVFIAAVGGSGLVVWGASRAAGKRTEAVAAAAVIAALLAAAICVVGFLLWFGQNQCGE